MELFFYFNCMCSCVGLHRCINLVQYDPDISTWQHVLIYSASVVEFLDLVKRFTVYGVPTKTFLENNSHVILFLC